MSTRDAAIRATPAESRGFFGHPTGLSTLFFTEMWERFSYYGIRPLLVLFMSAALADGGFGIERSQASAIVGIYAASVYLASLPGGWVADRLLGLRRAIMLGAILISVGHISIGLSSFAHSRVPFFLGLIFIVLGTGLLKPNISAIVGDLYPEGGARRDAGFSIFYMGINLGSFFGQLVTGYLGEQVDWHVGMGAAGVAMLIGLTVYGLRAKPTLGSIGLEPTRHPDPAVQAREQRTVKVATAAFLAVLAVVFVLAASGTLRLNASGIAEYMTYAMVGMAVVFFAFVFGFGKLSSDEKKRVGVIVVLFAFAAIWVGMARRGVDLASPVKFALGLALAGIGFVIMIFAANVVVSSGGRSLVSPWWLVGSYFFQTVGELCISPVGLSSMTKLSPRKYVGQMMGIWFLASALGNLIGGRVGGHVDPEKLEQMPRLFSITTASLLIAAVVLLALSVPIRRMMVGTDQQGARS